MTRRTQCPSARPGVVPALLLLTLGLVACGDDRAPAARVEDVPAVPAAPAPAPAPAIRWESDETPATDATPPAPAVEDTVAAEVLSDVWYERYQNGQRAGWTHVVWTATEVDGAPAVHDRTEFYSSSTRLMGGSRDRFTSSSVIDLDRTPDGDLLTLRRVVRQGGREEVTEQRWTGTGYAFVHEVAGSREERTIACTTPLPVDTETFLGARIRAGAAETGKTFSYKAPNYLARSLDDVDIVLEGMETLSLATGPAVCWRAVETVRGRPGKGTLWIDTDGVLRKQEREGTLLQATTEARARALPRHGVTYSITVDAEPYLPRCTSLDQCVVDVHLARRPGMEMPDFPVTPFSREVSRDGQTIRLELTAHDTPDATVALPVTDAAYAEWLQPTPLLCSDHELVRSTLERVIGQEKDGRKVAELLLAYVFTSLRKESGPIPSPTAAEILEEGYGDCSEHNVLFVALCRAAGIPARRLSGYAQVGDRWGAHAFCEIWLGTWVGADPTTNELGTRARYIAFGWNDAADSYPGVVSSRTQGRMRVRTVSFREGDETVEIAKLRERTARNDPLSGLVLAEPPKGYSLRPGGTIGTVEIEGPGVEAEVSVQNGVGDTPVPILRRTLQNTGTPILFAGRPALELGAGGRATRFAFVIVPFARRTLHVRLHCDGTADAGAARKVIEDLLAPTLAPARTGSQR